MASQLGISYLRLLRRWRLCADLVVVIALFDDAVIFENIQCRLECRFGDFRVRCPATEFLVGGYAIGQHLLVDVREIGCLRLGNIRGWRFVHIGAGFLVGAHEGFRHVSIQPFARRC